MAGEEINQSFRLLNMFIASRQESATKPDTSHNRKLLKTDKKDDNDR